MEKRGKGRVVKAKPRTRPYPYEFRIKMVRLYLEEGYKYHGVTGAVRCEQPLGAALDEGVS